MIGDLAQPGVDESWLQTHAKNPTAPAAPNTDIIRGNTRVKTPAKNRLIATDKLIPTSSFDQ